MEDITLVESINAHPIKKGKRWLVTIARPGKGSSGNYRSEVLKATGPVAFPPGTKAFFKHARPEDRDVRDMVGVYEEGAFWNDEADELQAFLTPFPRFAPVLEEAGQYIEASIHARARKDLQTGDVKELLYDRANTADLVAFAGLEGSGLKYQVESLFAQAAADGEGNGKETQNMDENATAIEALTSKLEALTAKFDAFVAESKAEVKGEADAAAVAEAVKTGVEEALAAYAGIEKAINDAEIPASVKESLKEQARKGEDVSESLATAVSIAAETKKELAPVKSAVRGNVVIATESLSGDQKPNFAIGQWSRS